MPRLESFIDYIKEKNIGYSYSKKKEKFKNLIAYSAINKFLKTKKIYTPRLIKQNF